MSLDSETIHANGVQRHGAAWARANQRAVDAMLAMGTIKPWDPNVKETISMVVLKVLDGMQLDAGYEWLTDNASWTPQFEKVNQ